MLRGEDLMADPLTTVISPADLTPHLGDDDWAIVDCRFELTDPPWGERAYLAGHIPGAVYADLNRDLSAPPGLAGRHPLPAPRPFEAQLGAWGIGPGVQVVVYDQEAGLYASRLWWMLRAFGHDAVALLDGGMARWEREGRPVAPGREQRAPRRFAGEFQPRRFATADEVAALARDPARRVVDVRAGERYRGEAEGIDPVAGHIPGAVNRFARLNVNADGTMRPASELRAEFEALFDRVPSREVVFYCGSGVFSCHSLVALASAGLEPGRVYAGSWSEWCRDPSRPVATGEGAQQEPGAEGQRSHRHA
jgi:thiosulfate/3-mercaptopyruvate sulfurtransferase